MVKRVILIYSSDCPSCVFNVLLGLKLNLRMAYFLIMLTVNFHEVVDKLQRFLHIQFKLLNKDLIYISLIYVAKKYILQYKQ